MWVSLTARDADGMRWPRQPQGERRGCNAEGAYGHRPGDNPGQGEAATDDTELIAASLVEPARFAELFDRHFPAIHRYLRRRVGAELADDLAAETFTQAFARRRHYRAEQPDAAPWLYGIAGNLVRQHARAEQRRLRAYERVPRDLDTHDPGDGVAERVDASAAGRRAAAVLADLPADQREVLLLHAWGDLDGAGIAQALDLPAGTVRSHLHRARQRLRRALGWTPELAPGSMHPTLPGSLRHE
jgi:RNA polymerase sigma factor (sigma-70 family)